MAYRYGGELTLAREAARKEAAKKRPQEPPVDKRKPCGTSAAYTRHHRLHEPTDIACREAQNEKAADWRARRAEEKRDLTPCSCGHAWANHDGGGCRFGDRDTNPEPACDCTETAATEHLPKEQNADTQ